MDLIQRGKWALEALENTQDEKMKIDLLLMSICCGKLALSNNFSKRQNAVNSIGDLIALEPQFERFVAAAGSHRISSPSLCGESFYKIDPSPSDRVGGTIAPYAGNLSRRRCNTQYISEKADCSKSLQSSKSSAGGVSQQDLATFEMKFREKFTFLHQLLVTLSPPPKHEVSEKRDYEKEGEHASTTSARQADALRLRQQQLEDIIDVLVARLDKETKENVFLMQKLAGRD